jgi:lipopolysaccharide cholinephosphotransferase
MTEAQVFSFMTLMGKKITVNIEKGDTHKMVNKKIEDADDYIVLDSFDPTIPPCDKVGLTEAEKDILYNMLQRFDNIMAEHNIRYYCTGGTALGAIRHGGIIPWDDDADVSMEKVFFDKAKKLFPRDGLKWIDNERFGARVSLETDTFLSIDIFIIESTIDGFSLAYEEAKQNWPHEVVKREEMYPLKRVKFGCITIPVVNNTEAYLARQYGEDWRQWGYFPMVLHRTMHYLGKVKVKLTE